MNSKEVALLSGQFLRSRHWLGSTCKVVCMKRTRSVRGFSLVVSRGSTKLRASGTRRHDVDWLQEIYIRASSEMKLPPPSERSVLSKHRNESRPRIDRKGSAQQRRDLSVLVAC
jgi:hypothetical protein